MSVEALIKSTASEMSSMRIRHDKRVATELFISAMVYVSLTVSTALQFTWGPEATLRLAGFYAAPQSSRPPDFQAAYPDFGSLATNGQARDALKHGEHWKFSTFWADAAYYVLQTKEPDSSIAPYKYRWLPTAVVRAVTSTITLSVEHAFVLVNIAASLLTALLFERYLRSQYGFAFQTALLGGILFITSAANVGTLAFPMLEPLSALCSCLIFMTAASRRIWAFIAASIAGVATKEILVFSALLWLVHRKSIEPRLQCFAVAAVPVLAFGLTRVYHGASPLEVNYGFDLLNGEFPSYVERAFQARSMLILLLQVFLAFSFLWAGVFVAHKHPQLKRELIVVPTVILAALLFSGRISRVLGVLFPVVIPAFLWKVDLLLKRANGEAPGDRSTVTG